MTFNEFQRELINRGIEPNTAYMLTLIYEQTAAMSKRVDDCASVLLHMAKTIEQLTELNADTRAQLARVARGSRPDGIDVYSVGYDPKDN
jgi:hypothetical protein